MGMLGSGARTFRQFPAMSLNPFSTRQRNFHHSIPISPRPCHLPLVPEPGAEETRAAGPHEAILFIPTPPPPPPTRDLQAHCNPRVTKNQAVCSHYRLLTFTKFAEGDDAGIHQRVSIVACKPAPSLLQKPRQEKQKKEMEVKVEAFIKETKAIFLCVWSPGSMCFDEAFLLERSPVTFKPDPITITAYSAYRRRGQRCWQR